LKTLSLYPLIVLVSMFLGTKNTFGQTAPSITYTTPKAYTRNVAIPTLAPANTGGAIPAQIFGQVTTLATTGAALSSPYQSVFDASGNLFVTDGGSQTIKKITPAGVVSVFAGTAGTAGSTNGTGTAAKFNLPNGIAIDPSGNLYVSDYNNNVIRKITPAGAVTTFATFGLGVNGPAGITYSSGNLYVTLQGGNGIYKIPVSSGSASLIAGSLLNGSGYSNGTGVFATFNQPTDVIADASGNLHIVDYGNHAIRYITSGGAASTFAGASSANNPGNVNANGTAARFKSPYGFASDKGGNMYVADNGNNIIRRVSAAADVTFVAGSGTIGATDGIGASASFNGPVNLTGDGVSYMYISDGSNNKIRKLSVCGYTISPALPAGLSFDATTGIITGTPTSNSAATDYTIMAYNYYGSSSFVVNISVSDNPIALTDANTAANGISQGDLHAGQTNAVLFGFGLNANKATTVNGLKINGTVSTQNPAFYFTNGRIYKNTSANTFSGATQVTGATVTFNTTTGLPAVTVTGLSEALTPSNNPVYYFLVADINLSNAIQNSAATVQFKFATTQTDAVSSSTPVASYVPNTNINGTTFTFGPPTLSQADNNAAASGISNSTISYGQTGIVLYSFKMTINGVATFSQFDILATATANTYLQNGKLYRSSTQYFSDAIQVPGTVTFGATTTITGMSETLNSYSQANDYYYFLVGDFTKSTTTTNALTFGLNTANNAFTTTFGKVYKPSNTITGQSFNVLTTYKWVGSNSTNFNLASNYTTLSGGTVFFTPGSGDAVYIPATYTRAPSLTANISLASLTFDGATTPALSLSTRTLTISSKLVLTPNSTATITGAGTLTLSSSATSTDLAPGSILNITGAAVVNNAGAFTVEPTATLNVSNGTVNNTGTFTLASDATGSATIGPVSSATTFTGTYDVQRYFTGGTANSRGYRLVSSPVSAASNNAVLPNLTYVRDKAYTTGTGGPANGFDVAGNPTFYFYRENMAPNYTSFLSGNYRGVGSVANSTNFTIDVDAISRTLPAGNGFLFFFRGNRLYNSTTNTTATAQPVTFTNSGVLNQGNIAVKHWYTGTTGLQYTVVTGNDNIRGYNLVGNPYASSIDWDTFGTAITGSNISNTIWIYNPTVKAYAIYMKGNGGVGTNFNGAGANIIPSGQAFFVRANAASPTLTFTEAAKVTNQVSSSALLMSAPGDSKPLSLMSTVANVQAVTNTAVAATAATTVQYLKLSLALDATNRDETLVFFKTGAITKFKVNEDAEYLRGNNVVMLATRSADNKEVAINTMAYPTTSLKVPLTARVGASGVYKLKLSEIKNIPTTYMVWLKDRFTKDSLDMRVNSTYNFNANMPDTSSYGTNRFYLVIKPKTVAATVKLVDFTAATVAEGAQLGWTIQGEGATTTFRLERSLDGKVWDAIGTVKSASKGKYTYIDRFPIVGKNYYRLMITDNNGSTMYSAVKSLTFAKQINSSGSNISIYPNPATTYVNVAIVAQANAKSYSIRVTSSTGKVLRTGTINTTLWQTNVTSLMAGTYFIQVINDTNKAVIGSGKFVK
jgi:hypothetical protein